MTATDADGYGVWGQATGCDWVVGKVGKLAGSGSGFVVTGRGWFDAQWQWQRELALAP